MSQLVGHLRGLWRYPVKSMAPEALERSEISWQGLPGDRRWAFVRSGLESSAFPWLTLRQNPDMRLFEPRFEDPASPETSRTIVSTPSGDELETTDPSLADQLWPEGARIIRQGRGAFDTFPLSIITTPSIGYIGEATGHALDPLRFRPNLLIDTVTPEPFQEDAWVGRVLRVGSARVRIDKRDGRCVVITIDPTTGDRAPEVLREVAQSREGCLGVYATTVDVGECRLGAPIYLQEGQA